MQAHEDRSSATIADPPHPPVKEWGAAGEHSTMPRRSVAQSPACLFGHLRTAHRRAQKEIDGSARSSCASSRWRERCVCLATITIPTELEGRGLGRKHARQILNVCGADAPRSERRTRGSRTAIPMLHDAVSPSQPRPGARRKAMAAEEAVKARTSRRRAGARAARGTLPVEAIMPDENHQPLRARAISGDEDLPRGALCDTANTPSTQGNDVFRVLFSTKQL